MNKKIKFVIIGSGNIANTYVMAIQQIENAEVIEVVSKKLNTRVNFRTLDVFSSLDEIDLDFDAVIICTPNGYHHVSAVEAAKLGKHVLCEKPIDISSESIDNIITICKENKVKLGVAYQRRFSSYNPSVKQLIDNNKLGKIFSVNLSVKNYRDDTYYDSEPTEEPIKLMEEGLSCNKRLTI